MGISQGSLALHSSLWACEQMIAPREQLCAFIDDVCFQNTRLNISLCFSIARTQSNGASAAVCRLMIFFINGLSFTTLLMPPTVICSFGNMHVLQFLQVDVRDRVSWRKKSVCSHDHICAT